MSQQAMILTFQAQLRSLEWLNVYVHLLPNPVHQTGIYRIITLKRGLEKIKLPGLAAMISYLVYHHSVQKAANDLFQFTVLVF